MRKPRENRLPSYLPEERPKFAGAYFVDRVYGGPEEGGWYYNVSIHQASLLLTDGQDPMALALALWEEFSHMDDGRDLGSVLSDGAIFIMWEDSPAQHHDNERRHYE
jgi:hypothetical protein